MPGLYVHIPFCASACPYCDFAFVVGRDAQAERYVGALVTEFTSRVPSGAPFDTVYFGGGTPTALDPAQLNRVLETVREHASVTPDAEVTVEANPNDLDCFPALRRIGVTRLSLGIQSSDDMTLRALGRSHTGADARLAVEIARSTGFDNVSLDAIFGGPGQSVDGWRSDLSHLLDLGPDHVSLYGLTVEPGTPYAKREAAGDLDLPTEDDQSAMYEVALSLTEHAGLEQYEISNFARPGHESRHNLSCWRGDVYVGIGMSAHSYDGHIRSWNHRLLNDYLGAVESGASPEAGREPIADDTRTVERVMLGLRTREGIDASAVGASTAADRLLSADLIETDGARIRLTRRGKHVADLVCAELVRDL